MTSHDDFPLDSFGLESFTEPPDEKRQQQCEMADLVSTVMALDLAQPIRPNSRSFQVIIDQISPQRLSRFRDRAMAWSGWAVAALLTLAFFLKDSYERSLRDHVAASSREPSTMIQSHQATAARGLAGSSANPLLVAGNRVDDANAGAEAMAMREQQRSLIQEIETLRKEVALLATRDQERLVAQNGISWPIIMKLTAPGNDPQAAVIKDPILAAIFDSNLPAGEHALPAENARTSDANKTALPDPTLPSAVPIYDPARDSGQLIVSNLNPPEPGKAYFLWMQNDQTTQPVLVGTLPDHLASSETFHFRLGALGLIPERFLITQDLQQAPSAPDSSNTILLGPE